jgi:hypothetical protein
MKIILACLAVITVLLGPSLASADETRSGRPATARTARARRAAPAPRAARREEASSSSTSLIRSYGSCSAAKFEELVAEVGRIDAMEACTSRGNANAGTRELSRSAPRQTDLGIPEEAFPEDFEVSGL